MSDEHHAPTGSGAPLSDAPGIWAERRRLASAMRDVVEHLVTSEAPQEELRTAADALERYADRLRSHPTRSSWEGYFREAANAGDVSEFFDFSPLMGLSNPIAPPIELWVEDDRVRGRGVFGTAYEGPPGHVHGGYIAAAFDEVLGYAQSLTGSPGMTGRLVVHYRRPTPLHTDLRFEGLVLRAEGRKILTEGRLYAGEVLCAESEGLFIRVPEDRMIRLAKEHEQDPSR
jgi:acyl-coenzyme A thioesterase PaaI-like protein